MTPEELLARFPTVRQAVAFVEFYEMAPTPAEMVRQGDPAEVIVGVLADAIAEELADRNPPNAAQLRPAREQLGLPERSLAQFLADDRHKARQNIDRSQLAEARAAVVDHRRILEANLDKPV